MTLQCETAPGQAPSVPTPVLKLSVFPEYIRKAVCLRLVGENTSVKCQDGSFLLTVACPHVASSNLFLPKHSQPDMTTVSPFMQVFLKLTTEATNFVSAIGSPVNSESPGDISTSIFTGLMDGSRAEPHTQGQEMALMSPLVCSNVASGRKQAKMDLALWEINIVLRVELWDTEIQHGAARCMAKWQMSD
ncbi:unnamed protein product [Leuciscus chuanchicus]